MNLRLPVPSDGSDHGTTSTGSSAEHSTDHSESIINHLSVTEVEAAKEGDLTVGQKKAQQRMFGPVAVVPERLIRFSQKGAVTPTLALHQSDVGIRVHLVAALVGETNERVVQRMQDLGRHRNAIEHARSGSAIVVIISTGETGIKRRNAIVELTQRADPGGAVAIVSAGEELRLAAKAT